MRVQGGNIFLSVPELVGFGISEGYVNKAVKQHRDGRVQSWANMPDPFDGRRVLVNYDTIPSATRAKLPAKTVLLAQLKEEQAQVRATELAVVGSALAGLHARAVVATDYNYYFGKAGLKARWRPRPVSSPRQPAGCGC